MHIQAPEVCNNILGVGHGDTDMAETKSRNITLAVALCMVARDMPWTNRFELGGTVRGIT